MMRACRVSCTQFSMTMTSLGYKYRCRCACYVLFLFYVFCQPISLRFCKDQLTQTKEWDPINRSYPLLDDLLFYRIYWFTYVYLLTYVINIKNAFKVCAFRWFWFERKLLNVILIKKMHNMQHVTTASLLFWLAIAKKDDNLCTNITLEIQTLLDDDPPHRVVFSLRSSVGKIRMLPTHSPLFPQLHITLLFEWKSWSKNLLICIDLGWNGAAG